MVTSERPFVWQNETEGREIEDFMLTLCLALPGVAKEILSVGFGNLHQWYGGRRPGASTHWRNATCGCLIGQASIEARKQVPGVVKLIETQQAATLFTKEAPYVLYIAIATATKRDISRYRTPRDFSDVSYKKDIDPLLKEIVDVGSGVASEADGWFPVGGYVETEDREVEVAEYLLDYIRVILTDIGFTNLPESPERATVSDETGY